MHLKKCILNLEEQICLKLTLVILKIPPLGKTFPIFYPGFGGGAGGARRETSTMGGHLYPDFLIGDAYVAEDARATGQWRHDTVEAVLRSALPTGC